MLDAAGWTECQTVSYTHLNGGFAVCAGLEQLVQYIQNLHFDEEDIAFLREKGLFSEEFLDYLRHFRFTGDTVSYTHLGRRHRGSAEERAL